MPKYLKTLVTSWKQDEWAAKTFTHPNMGVLRGKGWHVRFSRRETVAAA
jgi:hypothetical protein